MSERLDDIMHKTAVALGLLRGYSPEERDLASQALANLWIRDLHPTERAFLLSTASKAAPDEVWDKHVADITGVPVLEGV